MTAADPAPDAALARRLARVDWDGAAASLDDGGFARTGPLLTARQCDALARLFGDDARFRATVDLARHRYGERGSYRYFARPLPPLVDALRSALYPPLARIANRWQEALGADERFPETLPAFLARCAEAGQTRPTPLLLHYDTGGLNCLHQDRYGAVAFPLQVVIGLSRPDTDYEGGEFLLVEQRPRQQSRGTALRLERGHGIVFPNAERPVAGSRGLYRARIRHGVSVVTHGDRTTLGLIFHDAA